MGVAQKTMFSISDRLAEFFGISGAPMEHNAIAKSKQTFFYKLAPDYNAAVRNCKNLQKVIHFCDFSIIT